MKHRSIIKFINLTLCLLALALGWLANMLQWVDTLDKGFVYAHAGIGVLVLGIFLVLLALGQENALQRFGTWFIRCLRYVLAVTLTGLLAFVATKLVTVDFYVAYLLLAFGQCMITVDFVGDTKGLAKKIADLRAKAPAKRAANKSGSPQQRGIFRKPGGKPASAAQVEKSPNPQPAAVVSDADATSGSGAKVNPDPSGA